LFASRSLKEFIFRHLILPLFLGKTFDFISYLIRNRLGDFKDKEIKYLILFWIAIFGICFYVNVLDILLMYWFVPLLTSFPMVGHFIEMAEHFPIIKNKREIEKSWNRFGNKIELFFTGLHKENYHLIHHLFANIPFWNLDKAHNILCKNEEYRLLNSNMGGIFSSSNKASSLWKKIIKKELKIC
ncbi:fatty acid desaturase, partial [Campylobacter coli]|nr:fatty acid desaturase [Campylobacter coli]HBK2072101.1 fatty acid desaturase [Campylobacter coli]